MAIYALGDIQGCCDELQALLARLDFDPGRDRLWLVGDLVNRGPQSLETLRFVKDLGEAAICVLGNHDVHLLTVEAGHRKPKKGDTLQPILDAPERRELVNWLRRRPLLHHDAALGYTMVHAGLPPAWDLEQAQRCAHELETALRAPSYRELLINLYGDEPDQWSESLRGWPRLRYIANALLRMRFCDARGRIALEAKGAPDSGPPGLMPWFEVPGRRNAELNIVFGHWSTLGYHRARGLIATDSGCVWGGPLTAVRLDVEPIAAIQLPCPGARTPG